MFVYQNYESDNKKATINEKTLNLTVEPIKQINVIRIANKEKY